MPRPQTLKNFLSARAQLVPDASYATATVVREGDGVFASELFACERAHDRRLWHDEKHLLDEFIDTRRRELGLQYLPRTSSMCPGVTEPTYDLKSAGRRTGEPLRQWLNARACLVPRTIASSGEGPDGRVVTMAGQFYPDQLDAAERHHGRRLDASELGLLEQYVAQHPGAA